MRTYLHDLPADLVAPVTTALGALGWDVLVLAPTGAQPDALLVIAAETAQEAELRVAAFAQNAPQAQTDGADLRAGAQVVWLLPAGTSGMLGGAVQRLALAHAPQLRVNALHLAPRHAPTPEWQAAWHAAQPHPAPLPLPKAPELALGLILESPSLTGQVLNLSARPDAP